MREAVDKRLCWLVATVIFMIWLLLYMPFIPNQQHALGHDYSYFLPRLMAGYYWLLQSGMTALPYFTPAFCGGEMFYTNPQGMFFSVPQWLVPVFGPLGAIQASFVLFALVGYSGAFFLLKQVFMCNRWAALLGAALFLFNGFYVYRMIIGHLAFHGFMLLPWIMWCMLVVVDRPLRPSVNFRFAAASAVLSAYIVYSGGAAILLPLVASVLLCLLIYLILKGGGTRLWSRLLMVMVMAAALAASKLVAAISTMQNLEREAYPLPGMESLWDGLYVAFKSVFISARYSGKEFTNMMWWLDRHEFEYGITLVPLLVILLWLWGRLGRGGGDAISLRPSTCVFVLVLILLLSVPVLLNWYHPGWHEMIKSVPLLRSSSSMVRWYLLYIPAAIILTSLVLDNLGRYINVRLVVYVLLLILLADKVLEDKQYYHQQSYQYDVIEDQYRSLAAGAAIKPIVRIAESDAGDAALIDGISHLSCYEPLFGYRHEFFPAKDRLEIARVNKQVAAGLNMKNPACYSYPHSNMCMPGDHFSVGQATELEQFRYYHPYDFSLPWQQVLANYVSAAAWLLAMLMLLSAVLKGFRGIKNTAINQ